MPQAYTDRLGLIHQPKPGISIRPRAGAWCVFVCDGHVLFNHPTYAPNVPDLPGGGIDAGETPLQAALREVREETGLNVTDVSITDQYKQFVHFYADDIPEYWDYDQTFFLITHDTKNIYFEGKIPVPEGHSEWIKLDQLASYTIHHIHKKALLAFGLLSS